MAAGLWEKKDETNLRKSWYITWCKREERQRTWKADGKKEKGKDNQLDSAKWTTGTVQSGLAPVTVTPVSDSVNHYLRTRSSHRQWGSWRFRWQRRRIQRLMFTKYSSLVPLQPSSRGSWNNQKIILCMRFHRLQLKSSKLLNSYV